MLFVAEAASKYRLNEFGLRFDIAVGVGSGLPALEDVVVLKELRVGDEALSPRDEESVIAPPRR